MMQFSRMDRLSDFHPNTFLNLSDLISNLDIQFVKLSQYERIDMSLNRDFNENIEKFSRFNKINIFNKIPPENDPFLRGVPPFFKCNTIHNLNLEFKPDSIWKKIAIVTLCIAVGIFAYYKFQVRFIYSVLISVSSLLLAHKITGCNF
jgi:hypothetical protein